MSDRIQYLHGQLTAAQSKDAYFLLAAAASAIAWALNRTAGQPLTYTQVPLAIAVACWGLSFFFGCKYVAWLSAVLRANAALLAILQGEEPTVGTHPDLVAAAASGVRQATEIMRRGPPGMGAGRSAFSSPAPSSMSDGTCLRWRFPHPGSKPSSDP